MRSGEWFEIRVENHWKQRVSMTLLVDGLNSLGQRRERLGEGWSWVLEYGQVLLDRRLVDSHGKDRDSG